MVDKKREEYLLKIFGFKLITSSGCKQSIHNNKNAENSLKQKHIKEEVTFVCIKKMVEIVVLC